MIRAESIPAALAGERLDRAVALLVDCSRGDAAAWIVDGRVRVDGAVVDARSRRLREGARLEVDVPERGGERPGADPSVAFTVVHVDDDVIVVDKPAGLVVHPAPGHPDGTLVNGLLARFPEIADVGQPGRPGIVHRLDRGTSGLLVVARTGRAYEHLVTDLASHRVVREYRAVVVGHPEPGRGLIDAPIGRSARVATRMAVSASGKEARTRYEVIERFDDPLECALIRCDLETGRTHQIRVHFAAISHPVLGDRTYGGVRVEVPMGRPFLHAYALGFTHPVSGSDRRFTAELPEDLAAVLAGFSSAREPRHG